MKSKTKQDIEGFLKRQICYRSDDGTVLLISIGTANDSAFSSDSRQETQAKLDYKESFIALQADGSVCGVEISYNLDQSFSSNDNLPIRSFVIREVLNKLSAEPAQIGKTKVTQPIFNHTESSALGWVLSIQDWIKLNSKRHAEVGDIVPAYFQLPIPEQKTVVEEILRIAQKISVSSHRPLPVVDEPVPRKPETFPADSQTNLHPKESRLAAWAQNMITGLCLASVGAAAGLAALISLQSLATLWRGAVHVIGLAVTAIPAAAIGILAMIAFHKIDKLILKLSGYKISLFPLDKTDPKNVGPYVRRSNRWDYTKMGCVMAIGAAGTIGFMRWDNGNIYNAAQKYLLPAESSPPQPSKPAKQNDYQPKILLPKNRALYQAQYERCL